MLREVGRGHINSHTIIVKSDIALHVFLVGHVIVQRSECILGPLIGQYYQSRLDSNRQCVGIHASIPYHISLFARASFCKVGIEIHVTSILGCWTQLTTTVSVLGREFFTRTCT